MQDELNLETSRYSRQMRFAPLGVEGQRQLVASCALIVGLGALGSVIANLLARAGVGHLRLVDRDYVELSNLQRQVLYDEDDVASGLPKAIAAQRHLARINSTIQIEAIVADVTHATLVPLLEGVDCILDGTDNFETRFLLNDAAVWRGIPWVYGGCLGAEGQTLTILPGQTPCLRCLMHQPPPPAATPTCDSAGILGTVIGVIAALQANEAIKILSGHTEAVSRVWTLVDLWENTLRQVQLDAARMADCPCCGQRQFPWLAGERGSQVAVLCGRNAVQLSFPERAAVSLDELAAKLATVGAVRRNPFLVRAAVEGYELTVFPDGRAIIKGTQDIAEARSVYARYVGL